jgi:hypothetical protein
MTILGRDGKGGSTEVDCQLLLVSKRRCFGGGIRIGGKLHISKRLARISQNRLVWELPVLPGQNIKGKNRDFEYIELVN